MTNVATATNHSVTTGVLTTRINPDNRGRVHETIDANNKTSKTFYDPLHGQVVKTQNPLGWTPETFYDIWRRPNRTEDADNRSSYTYYDEYSRVTATRNPRDASQNKDTTTITYNNNVRPSWVQTRTRINGSHYTNSAQFYDGFGKPLLNRTLSTTGGRNWATANSYDDVGRPLDSSETFWLYNDNVTTYEQVDWNTVPAFTRIAYDKASRPVSTKSMKGTTGGPVQILQTKQTYNGFESTYLDAKNQWTKTLVDGLGRVKKVTEQAYPNEPTVFAYNRVDDLLNSSAPDGSVTAMTYDKAGRNLTTDDPDSGPGVWTFTYDGNGNVLTEDDPESNPTAVFTYDALNRRRTKAVGGTLRSEWIYDPANNRGVIQSSVQNNGANGTVTRSSTYDQWGRRTKATTVIPAPGNNGNYTFSTEYGHLDNDEIQWLKNPVNTSGGTGYQLDYSHLTRTGTAYRLKENGTGGEHIVRATYWNQAGLLHSQYFGDSSDDGAAAWDYDPHTLRLIRNRAWTPGVYINYLSYALDLNGNIFRTYDHLNAAQRQCFGYDSLDRLVTAYTDNVNCNGHTPIGDGNYNDTYSYNAVGNIQSKTGNGTYTYGDPDLAHAVTATTNGDSFQYDKNGNMTVRNVDGTSQTLVWDDEQRLEAITAAGTSTDFLYDPDGTRVRRGVNVDYVYFLDGGNRYDESTGVFTYYHQLGGRTVGYTTSNDNKTTWIFPDYSESTSLTRDENGVTKTQRHNPWGEVRVDGSLTTDQTFTGQVADQSTGLSFFNARYYDPITARFIAPDDRIPDAAVGQFHNRYAYNLNNPIMYTDPTGHEPEYAQPHCQGSSSPSCTIPAGTVSLDDIPPRTKKNPGPNLNWMQRAYVATSNALPGGMCLDGAPGCDPNAGAVGDFKQGVVNSSAGYLEAVSGGLAEDFIYDDIYVDESSITFYGGNLFGEAAMTPLEFSPAGRVYTTATSGVNAVVDCSQARDGECAAAAAGLAFDTVIGRVARIDPSPRRPIFDGPRIGGQPRPEVVTTKFRDHFSFSATDLELYLETLSLTPGLAIDWGLSSLGGP